MSEDSFRDRIVRPRLGAAGALPVLVPRTRFGASGVSDLLVCLAGNFIAIECKNTGHENDVEDGHEHIFRQQRCKRCDVTRGQLAFIQDVRKAGGIGIFASRWEQIAQVLDV